MPRTTRVAGALAAGVTAISFAGGLAPTTASAAAVAQSSTTSTVLAQSGASCSLTSSSTGTTCQQAIAFMLRQMNSASTDWHNRCLALVSQAYGDLYAGYPTASSAAAAIRADGRMHTVTDVNAIPRGAVVWLTNSTGAGHVVISLGNGKAISSDVGNDSVGVESGGVGIVPISYFTDTWGQQLIGWSAPVV